MNVGTLDVVEVKVDLDAVVPCEWFYGCASQAEWAGRHACCPAEFKLCSTHRDESQILWATLPRPTACLHCGAVPMPKPEWRPV